MDEWKGEFNEICSNQSNKSAALSRVGEEEETESLLKIKTEVDEFWFFGALAWNNREQKAMKEFLSLLSRSLSVLCFKH